MELIATQPYIKMERRVSSIDQKDIEEKRTLYLYRNKIVSKHREFAIDEIMDISFRQMGTKGGILYLHTIRGVYSYTVQSSPQEFINLYKRKIRNEE